MPKRKFLRWLLTLPALLTIGLTPAAAAVEDPFRGVSAQLDAPAEDVTNVDLGDWGVAGQRGAATYTYRIAVPPGRHGLEPELALRYSSRSPLRGGIAAGWTLDVPSIALDHSLGRESKTYYRASLGDASGRLVEVPEQVPPGWHAYRVGVDRSFTRFLRDSSDVDGVTKWVALTTDGVKHYFDTELTGGRWLLSRQVDPHGNAVTYSWTRTTSGPYVEYSLTRIEYTSNPGAGLAAHARVELTYGAVEACDGSSRPIGAAPTDGSPLVLEGGRPLTSIATFVRDGTAEPWRPARKVELEHKRHSSSLAYPIWAPEDPAGIPCTHAPYRQLTAIRETAYAANGAATTVPETTFTYNRRLSGDILGPAPFETSTITTPGFGEYGDRNGAAGTLLDLDADGVRDRLSMTEDDGVCTLVWRRGLVGGAFETTARRSPLPTAPWSNDPNLVPRADHSYRLEAERCTLNGQITFRQRHVIVEGHSGYVDAKAVLSYHFMDYTGDGRVDLVTSIWATVDHASLIPGATASGARSAPAPVGGNDSGYAPMTPEKAGGYVFRVYRNALEPGLGVKPGYVFSTAPMRVEMPDTGLSEDCAPDPLPPSAGDTDLDESVLPALSIPSLTDLDGDGFLDLVDPGKNVHALGFDGSWCVWFGHGGTDFTGPVQWTVPELGVLTYAAGYNETVVDENGEVHLKRTTVAALRDIDGNGLQDLLVQGTDTLLRAYLNTGTQFRVEPLELGVQSPVEIVQSDYIRGVGKIASGVRGYVLRLVDVDGDGLLDQLFTPGADHDVSQLAGARVRFGDGERFQPLVQVPDRWAEAKRLLRVEDGEWHLESDLFDADGDGASDLVRWDADGDHVTITRRPGLPAAVDLLQSVDRAGGLKVSFGYGPTSDPLVVDNERSDGRTASVPHAHWVVSSTTVAPGFGTPDLVTRYTYGNPVIEQPSPYTSIAEPKRFLGMWVVQQDAHGNGDLLRRTVRRYAYGLGGAPDGRVYEERLYLNDGGLKLHRYTENTWRPKELFGGLAHFVPLESSVTRTCLPDASEAACAEQSENVVRSEHTWTPRPCGTAADALYVHSGDLEGLGTAIDDRRTLQWHLVRCDASDYRVLVERTRFDERTADGTFQTHGDTRTTYDDAGLPIRTDAWQDASTVATTKRTFDAATGNLLSVTKPEQAAAGGSGRSTTVTYDEHALFVAKSVNELGHVALTRYDTATGKLIDRRGPNTVSLPGGGKAWQRETWRYDGLGREIAHAVALDDDASGYTLDTVSKVVYLDSQLPRRVRTERLRDVGGSVWVIREKTLDGLGRRLTETEYADGGRPITTTYAYDGDGKLAARDVPDPRTDGEHVRYAYGHDGLGRLTSLTRPDGGGFRVTYAGLDKIVAEVSDDGSGSTRREVYDALGRLVRVHELQAGGDAISRYRYDGRDGLTRIDDADGNVTTIAYDWTGRRVRVAREGRVWRYTYDRNGNVVREIPPGLPATTHVYDDIDRVTEDVSADPTTGTVRYSYDSGTNGVGRLSRVSLPFGEVAYTYDARGLVARETRSVSLSDSATLDVQQTVDRTYNALGLLVRSTWDDGEKWRIGYDARGLTRSVEWYDAAAAAWKKAAAIERSDAGQPRVRESSFGQVRRFTYDAVGRVVGDEITAPGRTSPLASRNYAFTDSGNVRTISGQTTGVSAAASYTYDTRHRLTGAKGPRGYTGAFTYSPAGNVLTTAVTWNGSTETRNVRYEYEPGDPQAVKRLVDVAGGGTYASYAHDAAGNVVERTTPAGKLSFEWDGHGRIRTAETPAGKETYLYDHTGARMLAVGDREVRFWFGESETAFTRAGLRTRRYLHLSDGGSTAARVTDGETIELQYADALQNLMLAVDAQGQVTAAFHYGPFGEVLRAPGQRDHRRQFNGKEADALTGLRYYGYRYYDPVSLRWTSADPLYRVAPDLGLTDPQRMNLYAFGLNNPVRYYDPDGRDPEHADQGEDEICEAPRDEEATCDLADETAEQSEPQADEQAAREREAAEKAEAENALAKEVAEMSCRSVECAKRAQKLVADTLFGGDMLDAFAWIGDHRTREQWKGNNNPAEPTVGPARSKSRMLSEDQRVTNTRSLTTLEGLGAGSAVYWVSTQLFGVSEKNAQAAAEMANAAFDITGQRLEMREHPVDTSNDVDRDRPGIMGQP